MLLFLALSPLALAAAAAPEDPLARAPSRHASFEGMRLHYKLLGERGPVLAFVHGWACNLGFWRGQAPLAEGARLLLLDLPGHGLSDKPEIDYTIPLFARALRAALDDAGLERAVLVGHSMGTPVVWQFSRLYPGRTRALVSVDGAFRASVTSRAQRESFAARYRGPGYRNAMTAVVDGLIGGTPSPALADFIRSQMLLTPQHVVVSAALEMSDPAVFAPEPKIDVPVLAVYAASAFWSADYRRALEALAPQLDYRTIEGVGHFLMLERPEVLNEQLLRFLGARGLAAP